MSDIRIAEKFRSELADPMTAFVVLLVRHDYDRETVGERGVIGAHIVRHMDEHGFTAKRTIGLLSVPDTEEFVYDLTVQWGEHEVWTETAMADVVEPNIHDYLRTQVLPTEWRNAPDEYVHPRVVLYHLGELSLHWDARTSLEARLAAAKARRAQVEAQAQAAVIAQGKDAQLERVLSRNEKIEGALLELEAYQKAAAEAVYAAEDAEFLKRAVTISNTDRELTKEMADRMMKVVFEVISELSTESALQGLAAIEADLLHGEAVSLSMREQITEKRAELGVETTSLMEYNRQTELAFDAAIDQTMDVDQLDPKDQVSALIKVREGVANLSRALEGLEARIRRQSAQRRIEAKEQGK